MEYRKAVYLPEIDLWLDPHSVKKRAFVSHAHFDHFARHESVISGEVNAKLMQARFGMAQKRMVAHPYEQPWEEEGYRFELLPAGHIYGSAMLHLTRLSDGATLLYTGDFKMRKGLTAEEVKLKQADVFITETTFGLKKFIFPPQEEVEREIVDFVRSTIEEGEVPILYGYSLGKAQEAVALMERNEIPVFQHKTVAKMTEACREAGLEIGEPQLLEKEAPVGAALVCPPNAVRSMVVRGMKNKRTAMLSGWAMNANAHYRYQTDAAFPLSDHADYEGLMEAIKEVQPKKVLTLHGSAREFATDVREMGIEAWSVFGNDQMELRLEKGKRKSNVDYERVRCELYDFSTLCENVERASGKLKKATLISQFLRTLSEEQLKLVATWLSGRPFSRTHKFRQLNIGSAMIRQSLLTTTGLPLARYKEVSAVQNEMGRTSRLLLEESETLSPKGMTFLEMNGVFHSLASATGSLEKIAVLAKCFNALHPQESESLVRVLTGGLRMGAKEGLLDEAIAEAFNQPFIRVRSAHTLLGDLGEVALLARSGTLENAQLKPFVPVKVMLASPEPDAESLYGRQAEGGGKVWLEEKYDGIRVQLHKCGGEVALYSRDLRSLNQDFPELIGDLCELPEDFILDGELIAYAQGKKLSFFDLQKRLGRKKEQGDLFLGEAVPIRFIAFDLLFLDGEDYLNETLERRRAALESIQLSSLMEVISVERVASVEEVSAAFKRARIGGNEGLISKDPRSHYQLGRRGKSWLKLKEVMPTLDCVVVKAQQGHGRHAEVLSDYTFAVKDERSGELRTIGKAYSGLKDVEIEELTEHFMEHTLSKVRRVHSVTPNLVLEIAFDSVNKSKRHDSGLALRFPRIKAIRRDKTVEDIDTLKYAESLL